MKKYDWEKYKIPDSGEIRFVYEHFASLPQGSVVLELGPGAGRLALNAPDKRPYAIYGVEREKEAVDRFYELSAQKKASGLVGTHPEDHIVYGDAEKLHSEEISVDGAVAWRVLHNLDRATQREVCKEIYESLKPGGEFIVSVASDEDWKCRAANERADRQDIPFDHTELHELKDIMGFPPDRPSFNQCFFSERDLQKLAEDTGFVIAGSIATFEEETGFEHLKATHPTIRYRRVVFKKPQ